MKSPPGRRAFHVSLYPSGERAWVRCSCSLQAQPPSPQRKLGPSAFGFCCCFINVYGKSFRAPSAPESLFSCMAKRKVTQREGHPAWRLPGIHARQVRELRPGFSTAHPCAGEKESASCRFPLRGPSTTAHRRTETKKSAGSSWSALVALANLNYRRPNAESVCFLISWLSSYEISHRVSATSTLDEYNCAAKNKSAQASALS